MYVYINANPYWYAYYGQIHIMCSVLWCCMYCIYWTWIPAKSTNDIQWILMTCFSTQWCDIVCTIFTICVHYTYNNMCIFISIRRIIVHIEDASISVVQKSFWEPSGQPESRITGLLNNQNLGSPCFVKRPYGCQPKNNGFSPKMDGENNGSKPYEQMDDLGGFTTPIFVKRPIFEFWPFAVTANMYGTTKSSHISGIRFGGVWR